MAIINVVPTKTNLLNVKKDLDFAKEGHELLEEKKDILVAELMSLLDRTRSAQEKTENELKSAYKILMEIVLRMGRRTVSQSGLAVDIESHIRLNYKSVMGVEIPIVDVQFIDNPPYYSVMHTSFFLDEAVESFKKVLQLIAKLAGDRISILRIAKQLKKTIHRVNALEKIYIPQYSKVLKHIESVLEEQDRQAFFSMKMVKEMLQKRRRS